MSNTKTILLILTAFLLFSCSRKEEGFTVNGKLKDAAGRYVYLQEMTSLKLIPVDSCIIDTSGTFTLRGSSSFPRFYAISVFRGQYAYLLAKTGEQITIEGNASELTDSYTVEGSPESKLIRELTAEQNRTIARITQLNQVFSDSMKSVNFDKIKERLDTAYNQIVGAQREYSTRFIEDNLQSQASLMALYMQIGPRRYLLDPMKDFKYFSMVDSSLTILFPESEAVQDLHKQVEELRQRRMMDELASERLKIGAEAPEIALPSPDGDTIVLSSLRGKIVLLDFWAAWCSPCRKENPNLVKNYKKYKNKGFEIYQVSLDQTLEAWLKGIEDDGLDWIHVSDIKYWNSIVVPIYNLQGIPANYLLDKDGKIIAQNLRGEQLGEKLEEIFNP